MLKRKEEAQIIHFRLVQTGPNVPRPLPVRVSGYPIQHWVAEKEPCFWVLYLASVGNVRIGQGAQRAIDNKEGKATIKDLAREFDIPQITMARTVKEDLGLNSYKRTPRQALKPIDLGKRLDRAELLLNKLKK